MSFKDLFVLLPGRDRAGEGVRLAQFAWARPWLPQSFRARGPRVPVTRHPASLPAYQPTSLPGYMDIVS